MVIFATLDVTTSNSLLSSVSEVHAITATCVLITTAVGLMCILYQAKKRWWLVEPDALLIALLVLGALYLVFVYSATGTAVPPPTTG